MVVNHRRKWSVCVRLWRTAWRSYSPTLHLPPTTPAAYPAKDHGAYCLLLPCSHGPPCPYAHSLPTLRNINFTDDLHWSLFQNEAKLSSWTVWHTARSWVNAPCCVSLFSLANTPNLTSSEYPFLLYSIPTIFSFFFPAQITFLHFLPKIPFCPLEFWFHH